MNTSYPSRNFDLGEQIDMLRDSVYHFAQEEILLISLHKPRE